jgi:hypothetical protein
MLPVGVFVSFTRIPLSPVWTIVMPYSAILFALFLISFIFQKEWTNSQEDEHLDIHPNPQRRTPQSGEDSKRRRSLHAHRPAYS